MRSTNTNHDDEITELHSKGHGAKSIANILAKRHGKAPHGNSIRRSFKRLGLSPQRAKRRVVSEQVEQRIVALHNEGCGAKLTQRALDQEFGISIEVSTILYHRKRLGLNPHIGSSNGAKAKWGDKTPGQKIAEEHSKRQRAEQCRSYAGFRDLPLFTKGNVFKSRYRNEPAFRLKNILRRRIRKVIASKGYRPRSASIIDAIGCTAHELKSHIETQFKAGMTWENMGKWHIDHIIPLASINARNEQELLEQMTKLNHYTNLQPLWAADNMRKGASMPDATPTPPAKLL